MASSSESDLKASIRAAALRFNEAYQVIQAKRAVEDLAKKREDQNQRARRSRAKRKQSQADSNWSGPVPEDDYGMDHMSDGAYDDDDGSSSEVPDVDDLPDSDDAKHRADQLERNKLAKRGGILAEYYRTMRTTNFAIDALCALCGSTAAIYELDRCGTCYCKDCIATVCSHPAASLKVFSMQLQRILQPFELAHVNPGWACLPLLKACEGCGRTQYEHYPVEGKRLNVVETDGVWQYQAANYKCCHCGKFYGYTDPCTYSVGGRYLPGRPKVTSVVVSINAILRYRRLRHQLPQCTVTAFLKAFGQVSRSLVILRVKVPNPSPVCPRHRKSPSRFSACHGPV